MSQLGKLHVYCGEGKGKTTAALGLGLRASGRGLRVWMVQFLKGAWTGELAGIERLAPLFQVERGTELTKFTWQMDEAERAAARRIQEGLLDTAAAILRDGRADLLILDEAAGAWETGMIDENRLLALVDGRPAGVELVVTGRNPPPALLDRADYVTEMRAVKHPWAAGLPARRGIED